MGFSMTLTKRLLLCLTVFFLALSAPLAPLSSLAAVPDKLFFNMFFSSSYVPTPVTVTFGGDADVTFGGQAITFRVQ